MKSTPSASTNAEPMITIVMLNTGAPKIVNSFTGSTRRIVGCAVEPPSGGSTGNFGST